MISVFKRKTTGDAIFDMFNIVIMVAVCFIVLYPIWYTLVNSFNNGQDAMLGGIYWWPRMFTFDNYKEVFRDNSILTAFMVSIARTLIATTLSVFFTAMVSYGLSKKDLVGRNLYLIIGTITLFFSGGLIPYFLLIKQLGMYDKFIVYIIPSLFYFYNTIIYMAFFREIPTSLEESAKIDGANDFVIFVRLIIPLSKPILATMALFTGVYHWNDYFMGIIYINNANLQPIQTFLYRIISESSTHTMLLNAPSEITANSITSQSLKLATMCVTTLPIVCVYPFLQKHFVKGMLLGSIKG